MLRLNANVFLTVWIMSTIMFTTVFVPIGLSASSGSFVLGSIWLIILIAYFWRRPIGRMVLGYKLFLAIILTSIILGLLKNIFADFEFLDVFMWNFIVKTIPKFLFLIFIYLVISRLDENKVKKVLKSFSHIFVFSIFISLLVYQIFPIHRFVWYEQRFAAFHYELVNFAFTSFLTGIIVIFSNVKSNTLTYILISILSISIYKVTLSNYAPIFIATIVFSIILTNLPRNLRYVLFIVYFLTLIGILIILPIIFSYIEHVLFLFPRTTLTLSDENPIWIRLHRHIFAIEYFWRNLGTISYGFFNGGIDADLNLLLFDSWTGGSGLSKVFMDLGLLIVPFLFLLCGAFLKMASVLNEKCREDKMYFILGNLCLAYGYLQAGFFNFTSVVVFLLCLKHFRII